MLKMGITLCYFQYYYCEGCHEEERRALLQIKDSLNPIQDNRLHNWVDKDCCKWDGIKCDNSSSRVVHLDLNNVRNWTDDVRSWYPNTTMFSSFKMLRYLDLSGNKIGGNGRDLLQSMGSLKKLRYLDLKDNGMDGNGTELLQVICQFNLIEHLDVSFNSLEGVVPPCLGNLTSVKFLELSTNKFQGNILSLSGLNDLEMLSMPNNQFQGNILHLFGEDYPIRSRDPSNFSNATISPPWKKLQWLDVGNNELTGDGWDLAQVVCQFSLLEFLDVSRNSLRGVVPPCLAICQLKSLEVLSLSNNSLEGRLHPCLGMMHSISILDLSYNRFQGNVPLLSGGVMLNYVPLKMQSAIHMST